MFELIPFDRRMPMHYAPMHSFESCFDENCKKMLSGFTVDIADNGSSFLIDAELPGFSKEDIKISVEKDLLTISAEKKHEESDSKSNYIRRERYCGSYSRSFNLEGIDVDKIEASYNNGILNVVLPKLSDNAPVSKQIEIR